MNFSDSLKKIIHLDALIIDIEIRELINRFNCNQGIRIHWMFSYEAQHLRGKNSHGVSIQNLSPIKYW